MLRELMDDNKAVAAAMRKAHELCDEHEDVATREPAGDLHRRDREADLVPVRGRAQGGRDRALTSVRLRGVNGLAQGEGALVARPRPWTVS